jgi:5-methylcytosine-specific restriction protein A
MRSDSAGLPFRVGEVYHRRRDIHGRYGGQQQGGISTPQRVPVLFLFTGESGEQYGYKDGWNEDGVFLYTGEGQVGPMEFVRGNRAICDHSTNGKELLLFEKLRDGTGYRFLGNFGCAGYEFREAPDRHGRARKVIVFQLLSVTHHDR